MIQIKYRDGNNPVLLEHFNEIGEHLFKYGYQNDCFYKTHVSFEKNI